MLGLHRASLRMITGIRYGFGSYYKMVQMFSELEKINGNNDKLTKIREFKANLNEKDREDFNKLMDWYSKK